MNRASLEFALEHLKPHDWKRFEEFASEFLVSELPNLRTVASSSGDKARDAELFSPKDEPSVILQYSVTDSWSTKIRNTAQRLRETSATASVLVYVSSKRIGARADALRVSLRKDFQLLLDIRDCDWFLERRNSSAQTESASSALFEAIAQPILVSKELIKGKALGLSDVEARAALVYLNLQWEDDTRKKGLTKLCFEALVRSALRDTDSANHMKREDIHNVVARILSAHQRDQVIRYTDAALARLNKRFIRHWKQQDEFCLAHHEILRLRDRLTELDSEDKSFQRTLGEGLRRTATLLGKDLSDKQINDCSQRVRRILERLLLGSGEIFVKAIKTGTLQIATDNLSDVFVQDLGEHPDAQRTGPDLFDLTTTCVYDLMATPDEPSKRYLRSMSDAYTLMAFLRETPDVKGAIGKMFSEGVIWLDTNILLPLFAETLIEESVGNKFQALLAAAREMGLKLRVTSGVLEELERHMNKCLVYARSRARWEGSAPFLVNMYLATGRSLASIGSWLENFRGEKRPAEDLAEYIEREFGIVRIDLDVQSADPSLRGAVQEIFYQIRETRAKARGVDVEPISLSRLAMHDTENYVGVIIKRKEEKATPFGYSAWWLTLDKAAFAVDDRLRSMLSQKPSSPILSPDFLANYLSFAPRRSRLSKTTASTLPLSLGMAAIPYMPGELLSLAESARAQISDLPEHIIRRRVRDQLDAAKARRGSLARGGWGQVTEELHEAIAATKARTGSKRTGS
jgi:hypothetical protein